MVFEKPMKSEIGPGSGIGEFIRICAISRIPQKPIYSRSRDEKFRIPCLYIRMDPSKEETVEMQTLEKQVDESTVMEKEVKGDESDEEQLSRRQMKKRKRFENIQNHYKEKKAAMKLKRKQMRQEAAIKRKEAGEEGDGMFFRYGTDSFVDLSLEERARRKEEHRQQKERWLEERKTSPRVLIDLDFKEFMRANEVSSLCQQVMYSYGTMRRGARPIRLCLSSVNDIIKEKLEKISGFNSWLAEISESDFMKMNEEREDFQYDKEHIIYLSADAEETMTELDPSCLYVIGGIVDRNRYKNLTLEKANRLGIRTAK